MIQRNKKLILTYELVKKGYVAKVTVDKSKEGLEEGVTCSFDIYDALGREIQEGFRRDIRYPNEIRLANLIGEMIDNHINGESPNYKLHTKID